ncbi:histidine kinase [Actinoplanes sp. SE50]|uniref:ATP-binding protein n=1 Tax=unclassified Actinoplanes TaxID=2626549 RepID=UPI00023ECD8E|nr:MULTISPECIES: ATP-binding protein [unclassified Actinoplanes]AEV87737.1 histidine kinase [Actinoplanes sp. SE50/110]ATO86139.1 histidine kinase [Actinoplanes sp. SE50]SLM03553.1 histidine kinase [Actinoplanes sp. SE50/110]
MTIEADEIQLQPCEPGRLTPAELKSLFLFEKLTDEQLAWIAEHGCTMRVAGGGLVLREGDPADQFFVLLSGTIALTRRVGQDDVQTSRTEQRGVYMGATNAYLRDDGVPQRYMASMRALSDAEFFVLSAGDFGRLMRDWFPMAIHLLEGLALGMRSSQAAIGERQRLQALGALSAGLMHELNNPAAAAARATGALRERVAAMRMKLGKLAKGKVAPDRLTALLELQEEVIERAAKAPVRTAMQIADLEDELGDWMDEHGVTSGWDVAPVFAQGGIDAECLTEILARLESPELLDQAIHWIGYALETEQLMSDIEDATGRVSSLVNAAKQYSHVDRSAHQWIDVHTGIDSTLVMLAHKIGNGVRVVKDYDRTLPQVPVHPAELNQVWTNLIDNAVQAMSGAGTLTIRTYREDDRVVVAVGDTGPGIPDEIKKRVFEPFFTTKPVGEGTGLGLDISYRIVVNGHGGDLSLQSAPGDTRFLVRLPLSEPASA